MYSPSDRHGSVMMYTWSFKEIEQSYKRQIKKLTKENQQLKQEIKDLKAYNEFLLEGVVRHYDEGVGENQK